MEPPPVELRFASAHGGLQSFLLPKPLLCTWDVFCHQLSVQALDSVVEDIVCLSRVPELSFQRDLHLWSAALVAQVVENLSSAVNSRVLLRVSEVKVRFGAALTTVNVHCQSSLPGAAVWPGEVCG